MNEILPIIPPPQAAPLAVESGLKLLPKSVPRDLAEHADRDAVIRECRAVQHAEKPARIEEFALIVERFALHYPENRWTLEERRAVMEDWRRLMGDLPPDILQSACDAYLMMPTRWFPTAGQLYAVAEKSWSYRKRLARRADETMALVWGRAA